MANNVWEYLGTYCTRYALYKAEPVAFIRRDRIKRVYRNVLFLSEADRRGRPLPFFRFCRRNGWPQYFLLCVSSIHGNVINDNG